MGLGSDLCRTDIYNPNPGLCGRVRWNRLRVGPVLGRPSVDAGVVESSDPFNQWQPPGLEILESPLRNLVAKKTGDLNTRLGWNRILPREQFRVLSRSTVDPGITNPAAIKSADVAPRRAASHCRAGCQAVFFTIQTYPAREQHWTLSSRSRSRFQQKQTVP
jgi:hypothetical protein